MSNYTRASSTREQITGEIIFLVKRNPEWKHNYFYMYFYNDQSRLSEQSLIVERNLVLAIHHRTDIQTVMWTGRTSTARFIPVRTTVKADSNQIQSLRGL